MESPELELQAARVREAQITQLILYRRRHCHEISIGDLICESVGSEEGVGDR